MPKHNRNATLAAFTIAPELSMGGACPGKNTSIGGNVAWTTQAEMVECSSIVV